MPISRSNAYAFRVNSLHPDGAERVDFACIRGTAACPAAILETTIQRPARTPERINSKPVRRAFEGSKQ